nr:hypothetical protein [Methanobrevibacter arboriphilus]
MNKKTLQLLTQLKLLGKKYNKEQLSIIDKIINKFILILQKQTTYEGIYALLTVNLFKTIEAKELLLEYEKTLTKIFTKTITLQGGKTQTIARLAPIFNENSTQYLTKYGDTVAKQINTIINEGITQKTPPNKITNNIQALLKNQRWEAERIVRTETMRAVNTASYLQAQKEGKKYYNTDPRAEACKYCQTVHANGPYPIENTNYIPTLHPHCACLAVYYYNLEEAQQDREYMTDQIQKQRKVIGEENIKDNGTSYNVNKITPKARIWN